MINVQHISSTRISCNELYDALYKLVPLIPEEYRIFRDRLHHIILPNLKLKDVISFNQFGQEIITPQNGINSYLYGEVIATIDYLSALGRNNEMSSIWNNIHHQIISVAKNRFDDGYYSDAVEAAFKEINLRVKKYIRIEHLQRRMEIN